MPQMTFRLPTSPPPGLSGFDPLPRDQLIVVGIVYAPLDRWGEHRQFRRPNSSRRYRVQITHPSKPRSFLQTRLPNSPTAWMPSSFCPEPQRIRAIVEFHAVVILVSISNDPACMDAKCCVLMVRTVGGVEIVLDTQLAEAVGAHFSSVFTMMVKRR
jgi:hypothetical protein